MAKVSYSVVKETGGNCSGSLVGSEETADQNNQPHWRENSPIKDKKEIFILCLSSVHHGSTSH